MRPRRAREVQYRKVVGCQPRRPRGDSLESDRLRPRGSDPERCGERALLAGRARLAPEDGTHVRRPRHQLEGGESHSSGAEAFSRGTAAQLVLQEDSTTLDRVLTGVVTRDAGRVAAFVAAARGSSLGTAPRLAEQRGAGPSCKGKHDGQNGCSKHDHARQGFVQDWRQAK